MYYDREIISSEIVEWSYVVFARISRLFETSRAPPRSSRRCERNWVSRISSIKFHDVCYSNNKRCKCECSILDAGAGLQQRAAPAEGVILASSLIFNSIFLRQIILRSQFIVHTCPIFLARQDKKELEVKSHLLFFFHSSILLNFLGIFDYMLGNECIQLSE